MANEKLDIKKLIKSEIKKTTEFVEEYKELCKPIAPENAIGRISRMDAINNKSINEAALRNAEAKLKNLKYAFSNIDNPEFGTCLKCKGEIPIQRVLLMPQSRFCVRCAR